MLDLKFIRDNLDYVKNALATRNEDFDADKFCELDQKRREVISREELLQQKRNAQSKKIGLYMKEGNLEEANKTKELVKDINEELKDAVAQRSQTEEEMNHFLMRLPNLPHKSVPIGKDENDNVEVRRWGDQPDFDFEVLPHWDLGVNNNIIDFNRGVKLAKSRFYALRGLGSKLERSLINFMIDIHNSRGYTEWWVPILANKNTLTGTGQLPKFEEDLFKTTDGMYLIPTAEVQLTNLYAGEVLDASELPTKFCSFTPCFRSEAGAAGRDTRGIIRVHQFSKVEMVKFAKEDESQQDLELMVKDAENILQTLELPYRVVSLCTGDTGFSACKTYDLEVWLPSYNDYKEISSCSDCWDFQARRANIKYKDPDKFKGSRFVHTLNGSGLAVGRTMAAILENYQNKDGSITVPEALREYMGVDVIK